MKGILFYNPYNSYAERHLGGRGEANLGYGIQQAEFYCLSDNGAPCVQP